MPMLGKNTARLLSRVQGKPHANPHEHHLRSPPASHPSRTDRNKNNNDDDDDDEEDYGRDPESSSDEASPPLPASAASLRENHTEQAAGVERAPAQPSSPATSEKRKLTSGAKAAPDDDDDDDDDDDAAIFAETDLRAKRRRTDGGVVGVIRNIHAAKPESKHERANAALKRAGYGNRQRVHAQKMALQQPRVVKPAKAVTKKAVFRVPKEISTRGDSRGAGPRFRTTRAATSSLDHDVEGAAAAAAASSSSSSSPLSSVPESPGRGESGGGSHAPDEQNLSSHLECAICGAEVSRALREDYEDTHTHGRGLNYKWQQRFCRHHKQHESRDVWRQRGYPDIDWENLGARLKARAYTKHLKNVLRGETASIYRDRLAQRLEGGGVWSVQKSMASKGKAGANVGTEYIVAKFADEIRDRSIHDSLVAAAGVQGGVSGFVQAVLVPELAVCLIEDDLGPETGQSAAAVIAESGDLGELLNPEVEDTLEEGENGE
nr:hypothetical protein CFP56_50356 [Quercus suber]